MQQRQSHRRDFLKTTAAFGAGVWIAGTAAAQGSTSPNEKIRFACIGVDGKGKSDSRDAARAGDVVAICDVDEMKLDTGGKFHRQAKKFVDWRNLFDEMADSIDAVTISTPDHTHAVIAAAAMRLGKHVYVQKPLTRSLHEARVLGQIAREQKVATQMGNQGTAGRNLRRAAAMIKAGVLGPVREVYVWTNRPVWPQGKDRPEAKPAPDHLHWDRFLGPAPYRPFGDDYHPFNWRGWWDFGTGSLGDMACHTMNMPFMALDLRDPTSVQAVTTGHNHDSFPSKSRVTYEFAAYGDRPALRLYWSDASQKPNPELFAGRKPVIRENSDGTTTELDPTDPNSIAGTGSLIVGEKGSMYTPGDYAEVTSELIGVEPIDVEFPESPGHFAEFVRAIRGGERAMSNLEGYAVPLTETVLLGNLAIWAADKADEPGPKIEWDAQTLSAKNNSDVEQVIRPEYRAGWSLG